MPHSFSRILWFATLLAAVESSVTAGEFNEVLSIGDRAPNWRYLAGVDGKAHSFADFADRDVLVLVFTCASCPTAVDYEDRINALAKSAAARKVAVIAISVNHVDADRLPALKKRAMEKGFGFPYLYDQSQQIARDHGAIFTPEFFVFDRERKLVYMGALDDSTDPAGVKVRYVEDAITAALKGERPAVTETIARGCRVRYARERRE